MAKCPLCDGEANCTAYEGGDAHLYKCPRCGNFGLTGTAQAVVPANLNAPVRVRPVLSHYVRRRQQGEQIPLINSDELLRALRDRLPTPREQGDNLIRWLGIHSPHPGAGHDISDRLHGGIIGIANQSNLVFVTEGLMESGMLYRTSLNHFTHSISCILTFDGWARYDELTRGNIENKTVFMALEFNDPELDGVVDTCFRPAVQNTGFNLVRLNDTPKAGSIDDALRAAIQSCRFLLADLSHDNNGAYWEAGYAEGLGKPVIYTCDKSKFDHDSTHFDTNHHLTVMWDRKDLAATAARLKATIRATLPDAAREDVFY